MVASAAGTAPVRLARPHRVAAVVFLATFAVFLPVRNHRFIFLDDPLYITRNEMVSRGLTLDGLRWAFTNLDYASNWFPLTWLSHMLDVQLFGLAPAGHHLMSAGIHALSATLLFWALWAMTGARWRSVAVALLFGLHPLRVESVAWAAERKDVLSALFWMLTLLAYLAWARRPGPGRHLAAVTVFALGLMTKPMLVTLPFVMLLIDFWPLGRLRLPPRTPGGVPFFRLFLEKTPFFALSLAASLIALAAQAGAIEVAEPRDLFARVLNAVHSYGAYLGKTVWPAGLSIFYPFPEAGRTIREVFPIALLLIAITVVAAAKIRARPWVLTGWLWYLGTLVPVLGVIQVGFQSMADRYTYLPQIGVLLAVVWWVPALAPPGRHRTTALVALAAAAGIALAALTTRQLGTMKDDESLYRQMLAANPSDRGARHSLGILLLKLGRLEEGTALLRGLEYRLEPRQLFAFHLQAARQFSLDGQTEKALLAVEKALLLDPGDAAAARVAARLRASGARLGRDVPAPTAAHALIDEQEAVFWLMEGDALAAAEHCAEAVEKYRRAVLLNPGFADAWNNLGSCYGRLNRLREAAEAFERALAADPGHPEARRNLELARRVPGP